MAILQIDPKAFETFFNQHAYQLLFLNDIAHVLKW